MKKYLTILAFAVFIGSFSLAHAANQYPDIYSGPDAAYWQQYYGPGYTLKQQQDKDALEYRLKSLESQIQGDPQVMINTLDSRIADLKLQWQQEKGYMTEALANHGVLTGADQPSGALSNVDIKYQNQINALQQQKSIYSSQVTAEQNRQQEILDIKKQMEEVDKNTDAEIQKVKDDLKVKNQEALDTFTQEISKSYTGKIPTAQEAFSYLDSLSLHDASVAYAKLNSINPDLAAQTTELYNKKYPNGKPGSSLNDDYKGSLKGPTVIPDSNSVSKISKEAEVVPKKGFFDDGSTTTATISVPQEKPKEGIVSRVFSFFKRFVFWK